MVKPSYTVGGSSSMRYLANTKNQNKVLREQGKPDGLGFYVINMVMDLSALENLVLQAKQNKGKARFSTLINRSGEALSNPSNPDERPSAKCGDGKISYIVEVRKDEPRLVQVRRSEVPKPTNDISNIVAAVIAAMNGGTPTEETPKRRGRPVGSKNRPKAEVPTEPLPF